MLSPPSETDLFAGGQRLPRLAPCLGHGERDGQLHEPEAMEAVPLAVVGGLAVARGDLGVRLARNAHDITQREVRVAAWSAAETTRLVRG